MGLYPSVHDSALELARRSNRHTHTQTHAHRGIIIVSTFNVIMTKEPT